MIDNKSEYLGLPLPNEQNMLEDDCLRISRAFRKLDEHARETEERAQNMETRVVTLETKAERLEIMADTLENGAAALASRATALEEQTAGLQQQAETATASLSAHAALLAGMDAAGHAKADGATVAVAEDGTLSVINSPLWAGRAIFASTAAPDAAAGNVGDIWLKVAE